MLPGDWLLSALVATWMMPAPAWTSSLLGPALHHAAQKLAERCDVPLPPAPLRDPYRRIGRDEAVSPVAGLHQRKVLGMFDGLGRW